jgi:hypothetical protein
LPTFFFGKQYPRQQKNTFTRRTVFTSYNQKHLFKLTENLSFTKNNKNEYCDILPVVVGVCGGGGVRRARDQHLPNCSVRKLTLVQCILCQDSSARSRLALTSSAHCAFCYIPIYRDNLASRHLPFLPFFVVCSIKLPFLSHPPCNPVSKKYLYDDQGAPSIVVIVIAPKVIRYRLFDYQWMMYRATSRPFRRRGA